ncbi:MAG: hypothetical protein WC292_00080 [Clostridia bacterium]
MARKRVNTMILANMTEESKQKYLAGEYGFGDKADFICHKCGIIKHVTIMGYRPDSLCRSCAAKRRMKELRVKDYLFCEDVHPADRELAMSGEYDTVRVWCKKCEDFILRTKDDKVCPACGA